MVRVRHSFPAWRIFAFGVEVTADVHSFTSNWTDARSPGLAEIVLSSPNDRYVVVNEDIQSMYSDISASDLDVGDGSIDQNTLDQYVRNRLDKTVVDPIKRSILKRKVGERVSGGTGVSINAGGPGAQQITQNDITGGLEQHVASDVTPNDSIPQPRVQPSAKSYPALTGQALRFPFSTGQCVFHTGDPVRAFLRDPFDSSKWYFAFTGFISDWKESVETNGKRSVTLVVEDALRMFRLARFALNPALYDISVVADARYDSLVRTWHKDAFVNQSVEDVIYEMTFGAGGAGSQSISNIVGPPAPLSQFRYDIHGKTQMSGVDTHGIGLFNKDDSKIVLWGPKSATSTSVTLPGATSRTVSHINSLADWQLSVDTLLPSLTDDLVVLAIPEFRDQARSFFETLDDAVGLTSRQGIEAVITEIGSNPRYYPVDFGRLMMLLPEDLGKGTDRSILLKDITQGIAQQTEFSSRLSIIYELSKRIDFSFYATPRGDIIFEMPLYNFRPEDFGRYTERYQFPLDDTISWEAHFEDDKIRTLYKMSYFLVQNLVQGGTSDQIWARPGTATLRALIPQFGIRAESSDPWGYIASQDAAGYYAFIKLSQMNADAWQNSVHTVMRIGVGPNRPCWFESRNFISTIRNVATSITWGKSGSVNQNIKMNYRRGWSGMILPAGQPHAGRKDYEPYGGHMANPVDYARFFNRTSPSASTKELDSPKATAGLIPGSTSKTLTAAQVAENDKFVRAQVAKIAERLSKNLGVQVTANDLIGSVTQRRIEGSKTKGEDSKSLHFEGLAVDILPAEWPGSKLSKLGITGDQVVESINQLRNEGQIPDGSVLWKQAHHFDHIHYGVGEGVPANKLGWEPGEGHNK